MTDAHDQIQGWIAYGDPTKHLILENIKGRTLPPIPNTVRTLLIRKMSLDCMPQLPAPLRYLMLSEVDIHHIDGLPATLRGLTLMDCTVRILSPLTFVMRWSHRGHLYIHNCPQLLIPYDEDLYILKSADYAELWDNWWAEQRQHKRQALVRSGLLKEELMAATWHPIRFMSWCVDEEERREWQASR